MVFANVGTLGVRPGQRDAIVALLTAPSRVLARAGCLSYEVGVSEEDPHTVFVTELWESAEAHAASLELPEVQETIAAARPMLTGEFGGFRFDVVGSPLRA